MTYRPIFQAIFCLPFVHIHSIQPLQALSFQWLITLYKDVKQNQYLPWLSFLLFSISIQDDDGDDDDDTEEGDLNTGTVKGSIKQATKTAKRTKARETLFQRIEESRKALEDELGTEKFLKVYRYIQVCFLILLFALLTMVKAKGLKDNCYCRLFKTIYFNGKVTSFLLI